LAEGSRRRAATSAPRLLKRSSRRLEAPASSDEIKRYSGAGLRYSSNPSSETLHSTPASEERKTPMKRATIPRAAIEVAIEGLFPIFSSPSALFCGNGT
jgi:hypothetical protein